MKYNRLGSAGLQVSELSFGSWVTFQSQLDEEHARTLMTKAYESGVNFFDNAEAYARGASETIMGKVFKKTGWRRSSFVVSTKLYWGLGDKPNERNTLNRKYLLEAIDGSLKRLDLEYVDLLFCHRPDPNTPIEETVWAMHDIISRGRALYWGTSEWSAAQIREACVVADRHHLRRPQMEQPQYNLFCREKVEREFESLYSEYGLGTTTWSPLASGLLTGKYNAGVPKGSRATLPGYEWLQERMLVPEKLERVELLSQLAKEIGCPLSQLAIAWCLRNPRVSTVILGATSIDQLDQNLGAQRITEKLDDEIMSRIDTIVRLSNASN